jgi:hypothetical protein
MIYTPLGGPFWNCWDNPETNIILTKHLLATINVH